jgi:hypothetical protein
MHVVWELYLDPRQEDAEVLHHIGARLMSELMPLEEIDTNVVDPAVSTEADRGAIIVELMIRGEDFAAVLQQALDMIRTAIHAIGGGTAGWPTPDDLGFEYRPGPLRADPVDNLATM